MSVYVGIVMVLIQNYQQIHADTYIVIYLHIPAIPTHTCNTYTYLFIPTIPTYTGHTYIN
jgi:hypothetical protein